MDRFITTDEAGGYSIGEVECSYADLVKVFGEPNGEGDGYKVSTSWCVQDTETGESVEIYDYKETSLYSPGYPSVEAFRARPSYEWHIGGTNETRREPQVVTALRAFINSKRSF